MSRPVPAPQPDLSNRLLAAVAERDQVLAARLGQQWVHRRGLAALDRFLLTVLAPSQGLEAAQWLQAQLDLVSAPIANGVQSAPVAAPLAIEEVPIDQQELAALESEFAATPELVELAEPLNFAVEPGEPSGGRPALFGRMKALLRQCLEDAIVGIDHNDEPQQEPCAAPLAAQAPAMAPLALVPAPQASTTPAPAPASLASLRAWLPDAEEDGRDLPRAC